MKRRFLAAVVVLLIAAVAIPQDSVADPVPWSDPGFFNEVGEIVDAESAGHPHTRFGTDSHPDVPGEAVDLRSDLDGMCGQYGPDDVLTIERKVRVGGNNGVEVELQIEITRSVPFAIIRLPPPPGVLPPGEPAISPFPAAWSSEPIQFRVVSVTPGYGVERIDWEMGDWVGPGGDVDSYSATTFAPDSWGWRDGPTPLFELDGTQFYDPETGIPALHGVGYRDFFGVLTVPADTPDGYFGFSKYIQRTHPITEFLIRAGSTGTGPEGTTPYPNSMYFSKLVFWVSPLGDYGNGLSFQTSVSGASDAPSTDFGGGDDAGLAQLSGEMPEVENSAPVAIPPNVPRTIEATSAEGASVTLEGSGSDDDGDPLTFEWSEDGVVLGEDRILTAQFGLGSHTVTLIVFDGTVYSEPVDATFEVVDTTAPKIISASVTPDLLWPPNHKMVEVVVTVEATDAVAENVSCYIFDIVSSEPVTGPGDDTSPDWETTGARTANLRAERSGQGSGRIYTLTVACSDGKNVSATMVQVRVAHDQGEGSGGGNQGGGNQGGGNPGGGNPGGGNPGGGNPGGGNPGGDNPGGDNPGGESLGGSAAPPSGPPAPPIPGPNPNPKAGAVGGGDAGDDDGDAGAVGGGSGKDEGHGSEPGAVGGGSGKDTPPSGESPAEGDMGEKDTPAPPSSESNGSKAGLDGADVGKKAGATEGGTKVADKKKK